MQAAEECQTRRGLPFEQHQNDGEISELYPLVERLVFNNIALRVNAALAGLGLAYLYEDQVQEHVAEGRLVRVLGDWCPPFSGYHLHYPSRGSIAPRKD